MSNRNLDTVANKILIVEDTPANIDLLCGILKDENYRLMAARDGENAIELALKTMPDLILLDVMMPGMDGYETCKQLKEHEDLKDIPVIFVTAKSDGKDIAEGFELGCVDYITKPFRHAEVKARVRVHLELRNYQKHLRLHTEELEENNQKLSKEIIERKRVEKELRSAKELANSVIHNIGNVINSVNFSAIAMSKTLTDSKLTSLIRLKDLLSKQKDNLGDFITNNPQGQMIPEFLIALGEALQSENTQLLMEITELSKQIDLIREATIAQQNMAKSSFHLKHVGLKRVIETSLKLQLSFGWGETIKIIRCYDNSDSFLVPKTTIAHVLMNIIKNAKEALLENDDKNRELKITTTKQGVHTVRVEIEDNGPGIKPEHLNKIFTYGFTTKTDGHGFGMNYCANVMKEIGGELSVESEGSGAKFILLIPLGRRRKYLDEDGNSIAIEPSELI